MREIKIYVETTWKGPARRDGVAMWIVEIVDHDQPRAWKGVIHVENGTEAQGTLMALINAFFVLKKVYPRRCPVRVFTQCEHVLHTVQNQWHLRWQENGWHNAKGKPVKNSGLWIMLMEQMSLYVYTFGSGQHEHTDAMQTEVQKEFEQWKEKRHKEELLKILKTATCIPPGTVSGKKYIGEIRQGDNIFYLYKAPLEYVYETEEDRRAVKAYEEKVYEMRKIYEAEAYDQRKEQTEHE